MSDSPTSVVPTSEKLPPGPKGRRFSNMLKWMRDPASFFEWLQIEFGDVVSYKLLFRNCCAISNADLIGEVFVAKKHLFGKNPAAKAVLNEPNILIVEDAEHRRRRKLIQPTFGKKNLDKFAETMIEKAVALQEGWRDGQIIEVGREFHRYTINVAVATLFGEDTKVAPRLPTQVVQAFERRAKLGLLPFSELLWSLPLPANVRGKRAIRTMDEVISQVVARAKDEDRSDLVSLLVRAEDEEGIEKSFTPEEVQAETKILLLTGNQSCAITLTWCLWYLLRNPVLYDRLEKEVDDVLGDRPLTIADYDRLPYTLALFKETLRLRPPTHFMIRTALEDLTLGDYFIPKGTNVQTMVRLLHRDEKYFPQAHEFRPERWLEESAADLPRHAYIPFGYGHRICVAWAFGLMQGTLFLASLVQRVRLESASGELPDNPKVRSTLQYVYKDDLPVVVKKRKR